MERSAAYSLVSTFLRQRSEEVKACEMVIELKNKALKTRVIAVGNVSSALGQIGGGGGGGLNNNDDMREGGGGELSDLTTSELSRPSADSSFSARFYIFKEDATGKRLRLHSSYEIRRLEAITYLNGGARIVDAGFIDRGGNDQRSNNNNMASSQRGKPTTNHKNSNTDDFDADVFDDDSIGMLLDFKNAATMTFSFESEAQREAIANSIKRLIRTYGSIEQKQTILGIGLTKSALSRRRKLQQTEGDGSSNNTNNNARTGGSSNNNGGGDNKYNALSDNLFGAEGEKLIRAKLEELRQDKQQGFGASDQKLIMEEMGKVADQLIGGGGGRGRKRRGGGGAARGGKNIANRTSSSASKVGGLRKKKSGAGGAAADFSGGTHSAAAAAPISPAVVRLFDNPHIFCENLIDRMQKTELKVIRAMLKEDAVKAWENVSLQAQMLGSEVETIQERIELYASHISGRKASIEEIEHNIINAHRKERNYQLLHTKMEFLQQMLELTPEINETVQKLQEESEEVQLNGNNLIAFFTSNPKNARVLCDAMRLTDKIMHNGLVKSGGGVGGGGNAAAAGAGGALAGPAELPVGAPAAVIAPAEDTSTPVEEEYPLVAVIERKRYFAQMRRVICRSTKLYANSILEAVFRQLWSQQPFRYSKNSRLVLQPHSELTAKLSTVSAIICAMQSIDPEGYTFLLRQYRHHMNKVYHKELVSFFDSLRGCVRRLGWQLRSKNSGKKERNSFIASSSSGGSGGSQEQQQQYANVKSLEEQLRGPSLLGNSNNKLRRNDVFAHWAETNEVSCGFGRSQHNQQSALNVLSGGVESTPPASRTNSPRLPLYGGASPGAQSLFSPSPTMPANYRMGAAGGPAAAAAAATTASSMAFSSMMNVGPLGALDHPIVYSNVDSIGAIASGAAASVGGGGRASSAAPAPPPTTSTRARSGSFLGGSSNGASQKSFTVLVPELHKASVRLHRSAAGNEGIAAATRHFVNLSAVSKGIDRIKGSDGGGFLRPDIAFGLALEATIDIILSEEEALATIFGLYSPFMGGPGPRSSNTTPSPPEPPQDRLVMPPHEISFLVQSSLRELFGGSTITGPSKGFRRRPVLNNSSKGGGVNDGDTNDEMTASPTTLANRKKMESNAKNPSLEWRHLTARERRDVVYSTPKGTEIDSDYVSSEGEGSDSDGSSDEEGGGSNFSNSKKGSGSSGSAAHVPPGALPPSEKYTSSKNRRKYLLERNVAKEQLYRLTRKLCKTCDRVYVPAMLCMVEALLGICHNTTAAAAAAAANTTNNASADGNGGVDIGIIPKTYASKAQTSYFCVNILIKLHKKLSSAFERHLREQSRSIVHCAHKFILQPEALLPCFAHLSLLIARLDSSHEALDPLTCAHYHHYDLLLLTLIDHCFDVLDQLSHVKAIGSSSSTGVSLLTLPHLSGFLNTIRAKIGSLELGGGGRSDNITEMGNVALGTTKEVKRGFLMQLRHNALFCYMFNALSPTSHARTLLAARYERCANMRDRYEELYLTRTIFIEEMPNFARFINMCTELVTAYTLSDLVHSKTLSRDRMEEVLAKLDKEVISGIRSSAARVKRHFTRDVGIDSPDEVFHRQLLKSVWGHYVAMIKNKITFLNELLQWEVFKGLQSPLSAEAVEEALREVI